MPQLPPALGDGFPAEDEGGESFLPVHLRLHPEFQKGCLCTEKGWLAHFLLCPLSTESWSHLPLSYHTGDKLGDYSVLCDSYVIFWFFTSSSHRNINHGWGEAIFASLLVSFSLTGTSRVNSGFWAKLEISSLPCLFLFSLKKKKGEMSWAEWSFLRTLEHPCLLHSASDVTHSWHLHLHFTSPALLPPQPA